MNKLLGAPLKGGANPSFAPTRSRPSCSAHYVTGCTLLGMLQCSEQ